jgi:two-component system, OmpR family, response regulator
MKLLIVEDEPRLLHNLARALSEEGYAVDTAATGTEGLFKATSSEYDAIVLDVMLPGIDGWEILTRLRETNATPVLLLTARDGLGDKVKGLDSGADDYLSKPFDLPELFARIRALVRRAAGHGKSTIQFASITLDTRRRQVRKEDTVIELTAREYGILEYLALHQGEIISRTQIYEHLFDENDDSLSNLVDVHIFGIRKKLGQETILTKRGQGYFIAPHEP